MDPLTQGLLGGAAAHAALSGRLGRPAAWIGIVGGMLADADILLTPLGDPALPQEWHRHFTHALAFAPIGGVLAALPFFCRRWYRQRAKPVLAAAVLAYSTHGLLDCCTSYGTHWLWPISHARTSWDLISIIDPIFTAVIFIGLVLAVARNRGRPAAVALLLAACYLGFGGIQHARATKAQLQLASQRGHVVEHVRATPTIGNVIVWRCLYIANGRIYADAVRVGPLGVTTVCEGGSLALFKPDDLAVATPNRDRVTDVLVRFGHFADGYTALVPGRNDVVADMRYSLETQGLVPLWGIRVDAHNPIDPVSWVHVVADRQAAMLQLAQQVVGRTPVHGPPWRRLP